MTDTVLTVTDARKRFGETEALSGARISLQRGEWLGLLGPNGAGKTTLVRAIAGRVQLDVGEITLLGRSLFEPADAAVARRGLGVVPQEIALYSRLSAEENLRAWGRLCGVSGRGLDERIDWALEWTGLVERRKTLVEGFSGGMKRRLNIACGVLHEPEVILLDEPTVGVDPQSRARIWDMLKELQQRGATLLLTTHQLDEAQEVCERITIVDGGKTIASGTFPELVEQTLGRGRRVLFTLEHPVATLTDFEPASKGRSRVWSRTVDDLAADLPSCLETLEREGHTVVDVEVVRPNLQAVFLHLTGKELRE